MAVAAVDEKWQSEPAVLGNYREKVEPLRCRYRCRIGSHERWTISLMVNDHWPFSFTGADIPPRICHLPSVLSQVCVIRTVLASVISPVTFLAQLTLTR